MAYYDQVEADGKMVFRRVHIIRIIDKAFIDIYCDMTQKENEVQFEWKRCLTGSRFCDQGK